MTIKTFIFKNSHAFYQALALSFKKSVEDAVALEKKIHVALSGGSTPQKFFHYLADSFSNDLNWAFVHLYWGDERCVPPDHPDSNFGMTDRLLIRRINIPVENIHRIHGEAEPKSETARYAAELENNLPHDNQNSPIFDWIHLGLGTDGHTASLFPGMPEAGAEEICILSRHPQSRQKRISITMPVINHARRVSFLVTGKSKAPLVSSILSSHPDSKSWPAAQVAPECGLLEWYLDRDAASMIS
jgi:6-phosphogluconolactonase